MTVALITSGQFVRGSLAAEFGDIPPSFLPLGNRRLYVRQAELLRSSVDHIFMSLPADFDVPKPDEQLLQELGISILRTKSSLSLGEAISLCANIIGRYNDRLIILYGDTIIEDAELLPDFYSMHPTAEHQSWEPAPIGSEPMHATEGRVVISGLFSFSNVPLLLRSISLAQGDFLNALRMYDQELHLVGSSAGRWFDFGHIQTYYTSCGLITTQRSFNDVSISDTTVEKLSHDGVKMDAEATWFESIPPSLRVYCPAYLGRVKRGNRAGYKTANTYLATLANLAVFGNLDAYVWGQIFGACDAFLTHAAEFSCEVDPLNSPSLYVTKTIVRLQAFSEGAFFPIDKPLEYEGRSVPSMLEMASISGQMIAEYPEPSHCIIHGDFCFSNIFYDFRSRCIKLIDPRGQLPDGRAAIYGDPRYDFGKLAHSVLGGYDMIIAGRMSGRCESGALTLDTSALSLSSWSEVVIAYERSELSKRFPDHVIRAILVQLFLSMLPLHSDDLGRQQSFLANAARLFLSLGV